VFDAIFVNAELLHVTKLYWFLEPNFF